MSFIPHVFFGYAIDHTNHSIISICELTDLIESPFQIKCLLLKFDPFLSDEECARVVIGFCPDQVEDLIDLRDQLRTIIEESPVLDGLEIAINPTFYCGVEWYPDSDSETSEESTTTESSLEEYSDFESYDVSESDT